MDFLYPPAARSSSKWFLSSLLLTVIHFNLEGTFTNVLNHTNLGDPNMNLSSPDFGQIAARVEF